MAPAAGRLHALITPRSHQDNTENLLAPPPPLHPGCSFHFHELGDFKFLEEGDGWTVDVTFGGLTVEEGQEAGAEKSFTLGMRVASPHGAMVSCSVPYLYPNTSRLEVGATHGNTDSVVASTVHLSPDRRSVTLGQMSVTVGEFIYLFVWTVLHVARGLLTRLARPH